MKEMHFGPIWFIPGPNKGKYPHCHSLYIEGAGILIDPAADRKRLEELREQQKVKIVLLSHAHEDHFTHLDLFDDIPLWVSAADGPQLTDVENLLDSYNAEGEARELYRKILEKQFHFRPRNPDRLLKDGDLIDAGSLTIEVIHTPGHTPGHLSFLFSKPRALFLSDYDLTRFGPWYGDRYSSIEETIRSVNRLKSIPADIWLTAHETGIFEKNPEGRWQDYIDVIQTRENKILKILKSPQTIDDMARSWIVYDKPMQPEMFYLYNEKSIINKHLKRLLSKGLITEENGRYVRF